MAGSVRPFFYSYRTIDASPLSVFWQVPQYILQGTGEVVVSVTGTLVHFDFYVVVKYVSRQ